MVQHLKAELRKKMLAQRNAIDDGERKQKSDEIMKRLFSEPHFQAAKCVAFYMPIGSEVDTKGMIEEAAKQGKEVLLPVVADDHHLDETTVSSRDRERSSRDIELYRFMSFYEMKTGRFNIPEPTSKVPPTRLPEVVVLPGVAFGLCMHRLGYGKGYFDRLLAKLPSYRIGICFDFQVEEKLPKHEDDQRVDKIITEKREIE